VTQNLAFEFYQRAREYPNQMALHLFPENQSWTFLQIQKEVDQYRAGLRAHFKFQDKVFILLRPSSDLFFLLLACFAEGIIPFLVDPRLNKNSWLGVLKRSNLSGIISEAEVLKWKWLAPSFWFTPSFSKNKTVMLSKNLNVLKSGVTIHQPLVNHSDTHTSLISLTSGSSGEPKLIYRNFKALHEQQKLAKKYLPQVSRDLHLPGYIVSLLQSLCENSENFFSTQISIADSIALIEKNKITRLSGPPGFIMKIVNELLVRNSKLESIESVLVGGAPISFFFYEKCKVVFPNSKVTIIYGATEAEPISFIEDPKLEDFKVGYPVGKIIPEVELLTKPYAIKNAKDAFEIGLRGPHVVGVGPHWTGDLAVMKDNRISLVGRISELVELNGERYSVAVWESELEGRFGIQRIACVQLDLSLTVFYEAVDRVDIQLKDYFAEKWSGPISFKKVDKIPVDPRHEWKIQRRELKNL
jgi:acyl-CoA synthetase (AMP-forming)/AMP-acid ligase II